jgi:hypothetical protein
MTAGERIVLLSAGTAARRQAVATEAGYLAKSVNWPALEELLLATRLLSTLGPRILDFAGDRADAAFRAAVAAATQSGRRQGAFLQLIAARVMDALAAAGICSAMLKGPLLGEALYGDPGRRLSSDIDLLVAQERLHDAIEVVRELGYAAPGDHVENRGLPLLHFALSHQHGELPPVELHWRIHWYETRFARERLLPPSDDSAADWRPAPVDELTALLLFYARDGFIGLRQAVDIGAWWDTAGAGLQPGALGESIDAYPALRGVLAAAVAASERVVGLPADRLIGHRLRLGGRGRIAVRLAEPFPRASQAQLYAGMGLIDGMLAPAGGFRTFIRRQVAPPREVVRERARHTRGRWVRSTPGYSARVLVRYALAMTRLVRPRTVP